MDSASTARNVQRPAQSTVDPSVGPGTGLSGDDLARQGEKLRRRALVSAGALPAVGAITFLLGFGSLVAGVAGASVALHTAVDQYTLAPTFVLLLPLAGWGYALRFLRWHLLIRRAVPAIGLWPSFRAQAIGFALSVTPGRVGELWKLRLVEQSTHEPAALGAGAMLVERATDLLGYSALLAFSATLVSSSIVRAPSGTVLAAAGLLAFALVARPIVARRVDRSGGPSLLRQILASGSAVLRPIPVALALLALVLGRAGDGLLLWWVVVALGHPIAPAFAILAFAAGGLAGGISLLPGGIGAAEATMVAVLATGGVPVGVGLVAALVTRALVLWIWVAFGLLLFACDQFRGGFTRHERPAEGGV